MAVDIIFDGMARCHVVPMRLICSTICNNSNRLPFLVLCCQRCEQPRCFYYTLYDLITHTAHPINHAQDFVVLWFVLHMLCILVGACKSESISCNFASLLLGPTVDLTIAILSPPNEVIIKNIDRSTYTKPEKKYPKARAVRAHTTALYASMYTWLSSSIV